MKNTYVEQMKNVLSAYYELRKARDKEISDITQKYAPQYAERLIQEVDKKRELDYEDVKAEILKVFEEVRTLLACSAELNVESDDFERVKKLMTSGFDFSESEIQTQLQKYPFDYTIQRWIGDTVKKSNPKLYDKLEIRTPLSALQAYRQFGQSALYVAEKIFQNHWSADLAIQHFDDPKVNAPLYEQIGSGDNLKAFNYQNIPISAMHDFDDVTL